MNSQILLNNPQHTFVIAEAGSNWKSGTYKQDLERAKALIRIASSAGADAIKFQTYRPETVYAVNAGKSTYLTNFGINESINKIFKKFSMPYKMIPILGKYCIEKKIHFMSTPFSVKDAKEIDPYVQIHKVASYEINHIRLLEFLAKTRKPILISTGGSTYREIDYAIKNFKKNKSGPLAILQCTAKYPAPIESMNISVIPKFKKRYKIPVGLSDHSTDPLIAPILAVGMGATIIEKHFTLNKKFEGPDHFFALNPKQLKKMIKVIRMTEAAKGSGKKEILSCEVELRNFASRSIQATKNISRGEILREGKNFDVLRPGSQNRGAEPKFLFKLEGKKAKREINIGDGISLNDVSY